MAHSDVRLLTLPDGYKLTLDSQESGLVDYGEPLEWEAPNGKRYLAYVDLPDGAEQEADNVESCLDQWVYEVKPLSHVEPEDGDIDEDEEDEEDDEDEDDTGDTDTEDEPDEAESPSADLGYDPDEDEEEEEEEEGEEPIYG